MSAQELSPHDMLLIGKFMMANLKERLARGDKPVKPSEIFKEATEAFKKHKEVR